jgi:hypothetical protein
MTLIGRLARAQVDEFLGTHRPHALERRDDHRPLEHQLVARLIAERNGPAAILIESLD